MLFCPVKSVGADQRGILKITGTAGVKAMGEMQLQPGMTGTFKMKGDRQGGMSAVQRPMKEKQKKKK